MKKHILLLSCIFSCIFSTTALAGQLIYDDNGCKYINDDGSFKTGWHQEGENWYYFDGDTGYAHHGWLSYKGDYYYLRNNNSIMMADRTVTIDGIVYQFNHDGASRSLGSYYQGWMYDDVTWYYRFSNGKFAANGWYYIDRNWYYFDEVGYMKTGLIQDNGITYYLTDSGAMAHDTQLTINGITYDFDSSGAATAQWPYKPLSTVAPEQQEMWDNTVAGMADSILSGLINDSMTPREKATAIYAWVRGSFRYTGHSATRDWVQEAYQGIRSRHGDCYTYFAVSQALLMRAGIPCIEVIRYTDNDHYWNLVQLEDGNWYHFDTTPRRAGGYFCLWTDAQMLSYSARHGGSFEFDRSLYPPTP